MVQRRAKRKRGQAQRTRRRSKVLSSKLSQSQSVMWKMRVFL